ncbi:MAG: hypothetical protein KAT96_03425, partial [Candidatus Omnitrophica bacterium]|nr:hypothetical protein [Candidatus Omnitrophota bacterium]
KKRGISILSRRKEKEQANKDLDEKKKANQAKIIETIADQEKEFIAPKTGDIIGLDNIEGMNILVRIFEPEISLKASASRVILVLSDRIKQRIGSVLIFIATKGCEKDIFICSATDDMIRKGFSCKKFISEFGKELSLTGGGSDKKIQGVILNRGDDFINRVKEAISKFIKK